LKTSPKDELAKMIHFAFCVLKEAPDKIFCVVPFIPQAVINGAVENYLGRYLDNDEHLFFLCDVAFINSGSVGAAVTSRHIVANTRFFGTTNISDWQSKSIDWNRNESKLKVGGIDVPYGNEIGEFLYKILTRYQNDLMKFGQTEISPSRKGGLCPKCGKPLGEGATRCWNGGCNYVR
jgi:hypothetical protein